MKRILPSQRRALPVAAGCLILANTLPSHALQWEWGDFDFNLNNRISLGAAIRLEDQATDLLPKLSLQPELCTPDDCQSFSGDPAPNQRIVDAPGAFGITNTDNGNYNYDQGDLVAATLLYAPKLTASYGDITAVVSGHLYYDPVNYNFDETHGDTRFQAEQTARADRLEQEIAFNALLREAFIGGTLYAGDQLIDWSVGQKTLRWGESNLVLFNTLNEMNPLDGVVAGFPGFRIADTTQPVPLVNISSTVTDNISIEGLYQLAWEPVRAPAAGSFLATSDVAGLGQDYVQLGLGNFNDDPNGEFVAAGLTAEISSATRRSPRLANREPDDTGQFGVRLNYFAEWLNDGTELTLHYLHYHSRLPYLSVLAADASCMRDAPNNDIASALAVCEGFNGASNPAGGREPLPIDTIKSFLDYPEGIDLIGLTFSTNAGKWAVTGELNYRPNLPLQIHQADIIFAGLQPAFPAEDIVIGPGTLPGVPITDGADQIVPGARSAVPDYLSVYRQHDIQPGDYIAGFERFGVAQMTISGLRIWSYNIFRADQLLMLVELGAMNIFDLTAPQTLPLHGPGDFSHPGPGADGTGTIDGEPDTRLQSPHQQSDNFVDALSWGWRGLLQATYNNLIPEVVVQPSLIWFHDIQGNSPSPMTNFVEGRMNLVFATDFSISQQLTVGAAYHFYEGGGNANLERDRDHARVYGIYEF